MKVQETTRIEENLSLMREHVLIGILFPKNFYNIIELNDDGTETGHYIQLDKFMKLCSDPIDLRYYP